MKNKKIKLNSQLIIELEKNLSQELKENYKGLWSISIRLVNKYFYNIDSKDYMYFKDYKALRLAIELMVFLSKNIPDWKDKNFNYTEILKETEKELKPIKTKIYNRWINNDLNKLIFNAILKYTMKPNIRLKYKIQMLEDLVEKFPKYNGKNDWDFKEVLGL